jgi:hypothetical protein
MTKWLARDNYQQYLLFNLNNAPWPDRKPHSIFIVPAPIVRHWILLSLKKHPAAYGHTLPSSLKTQLIKIVRNKSAIPLRASWRKYHSDQYTIIAPVAGARQGLRATTLDNGLQRTPHDPSFKCQGPIFDVLQVCLNFHTGRFDAFCITNFCWAKPLMPGRTACRSVYPGIVST